MLLSSPVPYESPRVSPKSKKLSSAQKRWFLLKMFFRTLGVGFESGVGPLPNLSRKSDENFAFFLTWVSPYGIPNPAQGGPFLFMSTLPTVEYTKIVDVFPGNYGFVKGHSHPLSSPSMTCPSFPWHIFLSFTALVFGAKEIIFLFLLTSAYLSVSTKVSFGRKRNLDRGFPLFPP